MNVQVAFLVGRTFELQFCGPSKYGHEIGLIVDCDEFCVRLGESVGRLNLDTVLAGKGRGKRREDWGVEWCGVAWSCVCGQGRRERGGEREGKGRGG